MPSIGAFSSLRLRMVNEKTESSILTFISSVSSTSIAGGLMAFFASKDAIPTL